MGDVPIRPKTEPEPTVLERFANEYWQLAGEAAKAAVPGVPVRRAVLFIVIGVALALSLPAAGIVALLVLALTDQAV